MCGCALNEKCAGLKREGETALDRPLALREIKCAAIAREEWAISLRQQITHIYQSFGSVRQQVTTVDALANQEIQVRALPEAVVDRNRSHRVHRLPAVRSMPTGSRPHDAAIKRCGNGFCSALDQLLYGLGQGDPGLRDLEG